jgi:cytidyltransferase-like protein
LQQQTLVEPVRPRRTIYMDGVFDLFHVGHLEAIEQCAQLGDRVIIGVTGDLDAANYKRPPIVAQDARTAIVQALQHVDRVVCPCPLVVSKAFMEKEGIDLVVHGFANDKDAANQENFFAYPVSVGKFQRIKYSTKTSTTEIIEKIYRDQHFVATTAAAFTPSASPTSSTSSTSATPSTSSTPSMPSTPSTSSTSSTPSTPSTPSAPSAASHKRLHKPQWFGASVALVTNNASALPSLPYPLELQQIVSSHVKKATIRRTQALNAIREATGTQVYDKTLHSFQQHLIKEGDFSFDTTEYPLRDALLRTCHLPTETNLELLHTDPMAKDTLLRALTVACASSSSSSSEFQLLFDSLVRNVCAPKIAALYNASVTDEKDQLKTIYYQAFPCIRIVQPGEFSIGPHADVSYGHHPCSINFYIPLTTIQGTSALHLESAPGAEDWHPIEGTYGTTAKHFAGATCLHWTTENKTSLTRVSFDVRMVPGPMFNALKCGGHLDGGQLDVYRRTEGYYSVCTLLDPFEKSSMECKDDGNNTFESTAAPKSSEENFMNVRSKAQEIRPRLYLTNFFFARKKSNLNTLGITHVLVCGFELPCRFPKRFTYHKINLSDNPGSDVLTPMRDALLFMKEAIESGGTLLVHCAAGGSRSVVFVMAFLLFVDGVVNTVTEALNMVKSSRPGVDPNFGFLEQLEEAVKSREDYHCGKLSWENRNNNLDGGKEGAENVWKRTGPLINPGIRTGYPFTVKNWDKVFRQQKKKVEGKSTGR